MHLRKAYREMLWENLMLLIYSLVSKIRKSSWKHAMNGNDARVENVDGAFVEHHKPTLISRPEVASSNVLEHRSIVAEPAEKDGPPLGSWSTLPGYLMESFVLYGASAFPGAVFPIETFRVDRNISQLGGVSLSYGSKTIVAYARWSWKECWNLIATAWAHWRREREIKKAVVALEGFDDLTLRQMGICHRSQIEPTIRYCRDC
jgi:hypothetical protein